MREACVLRVDMGGRTIFGSGRFLYCFVETRAGKMGGNRMAAGPRGGGGADPGKEDAR